MRVHSLAPLAFALVDPSFFALRVRRAREENEEWTDPR